MKNTIPTVLAVLLAAAAVFAVSRLARQKDGDAQTQYVDVVCAANDLKAGTELTEGALSRRRVDVEAVPAKAILESQRNRVLGQRTMRPVASGDYILLDDIEGRGLSLPDLVGEGEWAVPVTFADASLVQFLQPGVEIAILGTYTLNRTVPKADATERPDEVKEEATSVVFPRVKILDIGYGDGLRRETYGRRGQGTIVVSLPPQQAATLVAAQRTMDLYPALRRPGDGGTMKRRDVGMVTEKTFEGLRGGLERVSLPDSGK